MSLILAFDTSAPRVAAALLQGDDVVQAAEEEMAKGQAERLMPLCADLLRAQGKGWRDLDAIGVGIGPGNFTGIRIAVSAARGLALGLDIPAIGISAFDAAQFGTTGPCAVAVHARRGRVYVKGYDNPGLSDPQEFDLQALPNHAGPLIGPPGQAPAYPIAQAIAFLAKSRRGTAQPRPAPLYLRAADAAPARDAPPPMLP